MEQTEDGVFSVSHNDFNNERRFHKKLAAFKYLEAPREGNASMSNAQPQFEMDCKLLSYNEENQNGASASQEYDGNVVKLSDPL